MRRRHLWRRLRRGQHVAVGASSQRAGPVDFFLAPGAGWREALDFEGSNYVGLIARILDGLPLADIEPNWEVTLGRRGLLVPGKLFIGYTEEGGDLRVFGDQVPLPYRVVDPRSGEVVRKGRDRRTHSPFPTWVRGRGCIYV